MFAGPPDLYYDDPAARGWLCDGCGVNIHYGGEHEEGCEFTPRDEDPDIKYDQEKEEEAYYGQDTTG